MPENTNIQSPMVQFQFGKWEDYKDLNSWSAGTIYVTTDEQGIYFSSDGQKPIKLGNIIVYDNLKDFTDDTKPPYNSEVFYYITESNALIKYNGTKFIQLNKSYDEDIALINSIIGSSTDAANADSLWGKINGVSNTATNAQTNAAAAQATATRAEGKADANTDEINTIKELLGDGTGEIGDSIITKIQAIEDNIDSIEDIIGEDNNVSGTILSNIKTLKADVTNYSSIINNIPITYATKDEVTTAKTEAVNSAKGYTDGKITDLIGNDSSTKDSNTIFGAKKYADNLATNINSNIKGITDQIGNLANIMNFRGVFDSLQDEDLNNPVNGDVIIVDSLEYVYVKPDENSEGAWEAFGAVSTTESRFSSIENRLLALDQDEIDENGEALKGKVPQLESGLSQLERQVTNMNTTYNNILTWQPFQVNQN